LNDTTFPDHGVIEETMREILKIVRNKWKRKHYLQEALEYRKGSAKREIYSYMHLH
jgi:hypothetical protein